MSAVPSTTRRRQGPASLLELWTRHRNELLLLVPVLLVPLVFVDLSVAGFQATGYAWLLSLVVLLPRALRTSVSDTTLSRLAPYLVFAAIGVLSLAWAPSLRLGLPALVQLLVPVVAFVVAAQLSAGHRLVRRADAVATAAIVLAFLLTVGSVVGALPGALVLSPRPMAIALVGLFVIATTEAGRTRTAVLGTLAVLASGSTGGRTATAVLILVILMSPAWRLTWRGRTALTLAALVGLIAFSQTTAFQERFFFGERGTLGDALTASSSLNTAGRRELWPVLAEQCNQAPLLGAGPGAGSLYSSQLTLGILSQPHNDYLRMYCDVGLVGSLPFWGFFLLCGASGARSALRGDPLGAAALQMVAAFLLFAITDNVVIYTAHFMLPLGLILGLAAGARRAAGVSRGAPGSPSPAASP